MPSSAHAVGARGAPSPAKQILQPGRNCWRVERADRFYCVQDAADCFKLVRQAILSARHTIFILGWDMFSAVDLLPDGADDGAPTRLDDLLAFVTRRRPRLRCYILIWDYAALYTLERDPFSRWRLGWKAPSRVRFGFDDRHPVGGSHHQKIVVVDDQLAFCGGIDLTSHRWDTCAHRVEEPARVSGGEPYEPYHEVQAMATGPLATSLGALARDRWRLLGEKPMPRVQVSTEDLWPADVTPDLTDVDVAIARTFAEIESQPAIRECETLFLDSIAAARQSIYIESQYFTNDRLAEALATRLRESHGPEIIVVSPKDCHGWLEQNTMGAFRNAAFRHLMDADKYQRLRLVYPAASRSKDVATFIHSKVMVVDDELVRIGSANFSRRSMGVDSECDLAIEAGGDAQVQEGIRHIRDRLIAEHLGLPPDDVGRDVARAGSLRAFIDARQDADRTLARLELTDEAEATVSEALRAAADPDEPILSDSPVPGLIPPVGEANNGRRRGFILVTNLVLVPPSLVAAIAGLLLGTIRGAVVAFLASLVIAALGYAAGRTIAADTLQRWLSRRSYRSARQLGAQGLTNVIVLRLASVAGAGAIHLLCGAARLPFATFTIGTAIGIAPTTIALAGLGALLHRALIDPAPSNVLTVVGLALLFMAVAAAVRTALLIRRFAPSVRSHRTRAEFG
jgi:phospholipase D1/2